MKYNLRIILRFRLQRSEVKTDAAIAAESLPLRLRWPLDDMGQGRSESSGKRWRRETRMARVPRARRTIPTNSRGTVFMPVKARAEPLALVANPVLLRRLELQADREVFRWLLAPSEGPGCSTNGLSALVDHADDKEG